MLCSLDNVFLSQYLVGRGKVGGEYKDGENQRGSTKRNQPFASPKKEPGEINATLTTCMSVLQRMGKSVGRYWFGGQKLFVYFEHAFSHI